MNRTETETLLASIDMTVEDVYAVIKEGLANRYKYFKRLREFTTVDDMAQDALVYFISPMKSTGDIRLNHYIKNTKSRVHLINTIKQTAYQLPLWQLRGKDAKQMTLSLDKETQEDAYSSETFMDLLEDNNASYDLHDSVLQEDLLTSIVDELNTINLYILKRKTPQKTFDSEHLPFLLDTNNYLNVCRRTRKQLQIIKDLYQGYSKTELKQKYDSFNSEFEIIKIAFEGKLKEIFKAHSQEIKKETYF